MHGDFARNTALLGELAAVDTSAAQMVVIPPFPYLTQCRDFLAAGHVGLGAQDVSEYASGADTCSSGTRSVARCMASRMIWLLERQLRLAVVG